MAGWRKILVVIAFVRTVSALSCTSCDETTCVEPLNCKAGFVKGLCGCCDVCAKLENQRCGGLWYIHGKCANGLKCVTRTQRENQDGFLPDHFKIGVCEPDACQNITCGFRQNCKTNKRGEPVCVCPRGCGKAKHPVCGLLNGRQYRNKCKLRREECFTEMEIGLVNGKCKKCTHKGKEFKFGDSRPDAKPCETCVCHHGLWKCDIQPSCFLNNLPTQSDDLTCLTSQDGKIQVLPCPRGFSCRLPRSDNFHDSLRVGICKRNKATKPKTDLPFLEVNLSMNRIFKKHEEYLSEDGIGERRMPSESEYKETQLFTKMKTTTSAIHSTYVPTTQLRNKQQQNGGLMRRVCFAFPDERRCTSETMVRWYYNATTRNCVEFNYGGCGGNFNNFLSIEICQAVCQSDSHPTAWPSPTIMQPSPVYVSSRKPGENDVSNVLLDMCHDMKSGMSYRDGEKWHVDACTSCSCVSGRGLCIAATCPITCLNPVHVEGRCCPICKPEVDDEIFIDGEDTRCRDTETKLWFQSGESWNKDNCTKCVCFEGEISCMASVCSKTMCSDPIRKDGACCSVCPEGDEQVVQPTKKERNVECKDIDTGKRHLPGEGWNMNDCVSCFCDENGQQMCYESKCSVPKCKNPVHLQGRCCPVCPEAFHSVCVYDNHQYFQGDFMLLRDMCTLCKCNGNMWNCTKKHCNKTVSMFFKRKQTALSKQGPTVNTRSFINTELMENIRTDDSSEDDDDYIIEDPERMTRQFIEKFSLAQDGVEGNNDSRIEMENILKAMLHKNKPTTPFATSEDSQSNSKDKHNDPNKDDIEDPTERISQEETLPWSKDFDDEMWSNWDDPSYTDRFSQDKTDPTDVFGRKHL